MRATHILLVEDEGDQRRLMARILQASGYAVTQASTAEQGVETLGRTPIDLVLSDWKLPGADGIWLLREIRRREPRAAFILATAYGSISHAVEAVREGADDYLVKPFQSQGLLLAVEKALKTRSLAEENRLLSEALQERHRLVELIGAAPAMQKVYRRLEKVAATDATVLIEGESGTGKELAARAVHSLSRRSGGPFVVVDCAAIPEGLLESELFGAEKGAYTGADARRPGKFESAHQGTLFLDEIGELPPALQPKLLRVLQEGRHSRVGGNREIASDVRILAATNRDLAAEVREGRFREDLFYRLHVVPVRMPPLRERREDIPRLIQHFLDSASRRHGVRVEKPSAALLRALVDHAWPGNVRELGNVVERLVLLAEDGRLRGEDLPREWTDPQPAAASGFKLPPTGLRWVDLEKDCLRQALDLASGNRRRAAQLLDLPYKAFLYRLEKHGLAG